MRHEVLRRSIPEMTGTSNIPERVAMQDEHWEISRRLVEHHPQPGMPNTADHTQTIDYIRRHGGNTGHTIHSDDQGNTIIHGRSPSRYADGRPSDEFSYHFDRAGRVRELESWQTDDKGERQHTAHRYTHDEYGRLTGDELVHREGDQEVIWDKKQYEYSRGGDEREYTENIINPQTGRVVRRNKKRLGPQGV